MTTIERLTVYRERLARVQALEPENIGDILFYEEHIGDMETELIQEGIALANAMLPPVHKILETNSLWELVTCIRKHDPTALHLHFDIFNWRFNYLLYYIVNPENL